MSKICRAAHFQICRRCGLHARIFFSDGSVGDPVMSVAEALFQVAEAQLAGKLIDLEVKVLEEKIFESHLPPLPLAEGLMLFPDGTIRHELPGRDARLCALNFTGTN